MDMQLLNLIIQPLLGGAAGYITNEYAINMLFNTYTPLKIGGVIPKTRNEFIENISKLVEEDIINKEKVESILNDDAFIKNFDNLVEDFFINSLYESSDNLQLKNISCMTNALEELHSFIIQQLVLEMPKITELLSKEINIDDMLDKKQLSHISDTLYARLASLTKDTDIINKLVQSIIENNKQASACEIIGESATKIISQNISEIIADTDKLKATYDKDIKFLINEFLLRSNFYNSVVGFAECILEKNRATILALAVSNMDNFIKSDEFNKIILEFSSCIISYGKGVDIPLLDLVNETFIDKIKNTIRLQSPFIFELIIKFANENNLELQKMIEEAIDETINEQDAAKRTLLGMAKGSILNSISKNDVASTLKDILENKNNLENITLLLTVKAKQFLKSTKVSDMVYILEKKNILTVSSLSKFILNYASKNLNNIIEKLYDSIPLLFGSKDFKAYINNKTTDTIKDKIIFSQGLTEQITTKMSYFITNTFDDELGKLTNNLSFDELKLQNKVYSLLENNKEKITHVIANSFNNYIKDKSLHDIVNDDILNSIDKSAISFAKNKLNELKLNISDLEIYKLINNLNDVDGIQKNSSTALRKHIIGNLDSLLQNFIKSLAVNNLNKLDDEKLCEMAKSFMGNNLKPIMLFGGMLGIIAGIILAVLQPNTNIFAPFSISSAITYSLVGFFTNAIAINMLFKPYNEIKPIKNIPFLKHFSLGYIVKNKAALADSMSYAINEYLLTKDSLNELIDVNNDKIRNSMIESMSRNNYELLSSVFANNKHTLLKTADKYIIGTVNSNLDNMSSTLITEIEKLNLNTLLISYKDKFSEYLKRSKANYNKVILGCLEKLIRSDASISSVLPESVKLKIKKSIATALSDNCDLLINKVDCKTLKSLSASYENAYQSFTNKSLFEFISLDNISSLTSILKHSSKDLKLTNKLIKSINSKLDSSTSIGEMFDGGIGKLSNNLLKEFFEHANTNSKNLLKLITPSVSMAVQNKVTSNLSFLVRGAYNMMDGNKIVDAAVEKMLLIKLPQLIEAKKDNLYGDALLLLNDKLLNLQLKEFELSINQSFVESTILSFTENKNEDSLKRISCSLIEAIGAKASNIKLNDILKPLSLNSLDTVFDSYNKELTELFVELKTMILLSKDDLSKMTQKPLENYLDDITAKTSVKSLFKGINGDDLSNIAVNMVNILSDDAFIENSIDELIKAVNNSQNNNCVFEFVNKDDFSQMIKNTTRNLVTNDRSRDLLKDILDRVFDNATQNNFSFINNEAKDYIIKIITDASLLSIRNNLNLMLKDVELDKIAKEQINAMNPKKIHMMFNSFAGKYFRTLMLYGLFGTVFGINITAGVILASAYGIKKIIKKEKNI